MTVGGTLYAQATSDHVWQDWEREMSSARGATDDDYNWARLLEEHQLQPALLEDVSRAIKWIVDKCSASIDYIGTGKSASGVRATKFQLYPNALPPAADR